MANPELALYIVTAAFWASFGATRLVLQRRERQGDQPSAPTASASQETTAPYSRTLILFHAVGFGVLYFGVGNAVVPQQVPAWFPGQRIAGSIIIAIGAVVMDWALIHFQSWRFRAKVEKGHALATGGPFAFVRHPIYLALDLLAVGTAVWAPTVIVWIGAALMLLASDVRARAEERLLERAFGQAYRDYTARTRRFVPGIY